MSRRLNLFFIWVLEKKFGNIWLFFGCRQMTLDLYQREKQEMLEMGVLDKVFLALSRQPGLKRVSFASCYLYNKSCFL